MAQLELGCAGTLLPGVLQDWGTQQPAPGSLTRQARRRQLSPKG